MRLFSDKPEMSIFISFRLGKMQLFFINEKKYKVVQFIFFSLTPKIATKKKKKEQEKLLMHLNYCPMGLYENNTLIFPVETIKCILLEFIPLVIKYMK